MTMLGREKKGNTIDMEQMAEIASLVEGITITNSMLIGHHEDSFASRWQRLVEARADDDHEREHHDDEEDSSSSSTPTAPATTTASRSSSSSASSTSSATDSSSSCEDDHVDDDADDEEGEVVELLDRLVPRPLTIRKIPFDLDFNIDIGGVGGDASAGCEHRGVARLESPTLGNFEAATLGMEVVSEVADGEQKQQQQMRAREPFLDDEIDDDEQSTGSRVLKCALSLLLMDGDEQREAEAAITEFLYPTRPLASLAPHPPAAATLNTEAPRRVSRLNFRRFFNKCDAADARVEEHETTKSVVPVVILTPAKESATSSRRADQCCSCCSSSSSDDSESSTKTGYLTVPVSDGRAYHIYADERLHLVDDDDARLIRQWQEDEEQEREERAREEEDECAGFLDYSSFADVHIGDIGGCYDGREWGDCWNS